MAKENKNLKLKDKIKNLISKWWFWAIVGIVSWIIMFQIPIQWDDTGFSFNKWEGINFYGTLFAYITQFSWIIAFVLIFVGIIKWIQKTSIGDYWKISFTILGVIGIIAYVFYSLSGMSLFNSSSDYDSEEWLKNNLNEDYGYEVISVGSYGTSNNSYAYLNMKSLGNREEQVWNGLTNLWVIYKNASSYSVTILSPIDECYYYVEGTYMSAWNRALHGETIFFQDGSNMSDLEYYGAVKEMVIKSAKCS
jgi:hypothetical protein